QHKMLMDHSDAGRNRGLAVTDYNGRTIDTDFSVVGRIKTVEDRHQRRLSRSVFSDNAVDCPLGNRQVDVLVGMDRAKLLVDPDKFDRRCCGRIEAQASAFRDSRYEKGACSIAASAVAVQFGRELFDI